MPNTTLHHKKLADHRKLPPVWEGAEPTNTANNKEGDPHREGAAVLAQPDRSTGELYGIESQTASESTDQQWAPANDRETVQPKETVWR